MSRYKLGENHDFKSRLDKLMACADELGIAIDFSTCNNRTFITDTRAGKGYELEDVDSCRPVANFPAMCEYQIVYEK
jgi:hypothetical protein